MAKQLVHIGVAVSTVGDGLTRPEGSPPLGMLPGRSNVINLAAACGNAYTFNENIIPQTGTYGTSAHWEKHPTEFEALKVKPVSLDAAMNKFRLWLKQFQGTLLACSSPVDFWHLLDAFFKTGRDCPFGSTGVIDAGVVEMLRRGRMRPQAVTDRVDPLSVAQARWGTVTQGQMPSFGGVPKKRRKTINTGAGYALENAGRRIPGMIGAGEEIAALRETAANLQRRRAQPTLNAPTTATYLGQLAGTGLQAAPTPDPTAAYTLRQWTDRFNDVRPAEEGGEARLAEANYPYDNDREEEF